MDRGTCFRNTIEAVKSHSERTYRGWSAGSRTQQPGRGPRSAPELHFQHTSKVAAVHGIRQRPRQPRILRRIVHGAPERREHLVAAHDVCAVLLVVAVVLLGLCAVMAADDADGPLVQLAHQVVDARLDVAPVAIGRPAQGTSLHAYVETSFVEVLHDLLGVLQIRQPLL